jgi:hypothetical protein
VRRTCSTAIGFGLAVIAIAAPAYAQSAPRGDRGVFASGLASAGQSLVASGSLGTIYYERLGVPENEAARIAPKGSANRASAGLQYRLNLDRASVSAQWDTAGTYLPKSDSQAPLWIINHYASLNASTGWNLTRHTELTLAQSLSFQPARFTELAPVDFQSAVDPQLVLTGDPDLEGQNLSAESSARMVHTFTQRFSVSADYIFSRRTLSNSDFALQSQQAGIATHFGITRNLTLRAGYRFADTQSGAPGSPHFSTHNADIGLDYDRALTLRLTRHTTLDLTAGLGAIVDQRRQQHYRVNGTAQLNHEMGRTWRSTLGYVRTMGFSEIFAEPLLLDTVRGDVNGLITRRVALNAGAAASRGTVGFIAAGNGIVRTSATAGLSVAMTRNIALSVDYLYYRRDVESLVVVAPGIERSPQGQTAIVSLDLWAPIFNRARRPHATR